VMLAIALSTLIGVLERQTALTERIVNLKYRFSFVKTGATQMARISLALTYCKRYSIIKTQNNEFKFMVIFSQGIEPLLKEIEERAHLA